MPLDSEYERGRYWPEPLVQINPNYRRNGTVGDLVRQGLLHDECESIFKADKPDEGLRDEIWQLDFLVCRCWHGYRAAA